MAEGETSTSFIYEFLLMRADAVTSDTIHNIDDFHYMAFIRNPVTKQSTIIKAEVMVPIETITMIESDINKSFFPDWELTCYQISNDDEEDEENRIQEIIYDTTVNVIKATRLSNNPRPITEYSIPVKLTLVNPIAYQMSKNTNFNTISNKEPRIALSILGTTPGESTDVTYSFMNHIKKKYAGSVDSELIKSITLASEDTKNKHKYYQISIPSTIPELNVPEYIDNTYKLFSTPSLWFLDTFNFGNYDDESDPDNGQIPIWGILLNFYNCSETFQKVDLDVPELSDVTTFTRRLHIAEFIDIFGVLNKPDAIVNFIGSNMTQVIEKLGDLPKLFLADNTSEKQENRVTSMNVYYPDELDSAKTRISDCMDLFINQIERFEIFETTTTTPDWLQFGKLYNLEKDPATQNNLNEYIHTPIMITNIFKRRQARDKTLECINKYIMLRLSQSQ